MPGGWGTPSWMQPGPDVGQTLVQGKTQQVAQGLLAAAAEVGADPQEVRAVTGGFIVPNAVYDAWEQSVNNIEKF